MIVVLRHEIERLFNHVIKSTQIMAVILKCRAVDHESRILLKKTRNSILAFALFVWDR